MVGYRAELDLIFIDKFRNPVSSYRDRPSQGALNASSSNRSLGLGKLELGLSLNYRANLTLAVVLRPDALNYKTPVSDTDTRAGAVYQSRPTLQLLDQYHLAFYNADNLTIAAGVFNHLSPRQIAYPVLLEFGLGFSLPQKFSAVHLSWNQTPDAIDHATPGASERGFFADLFVYQVMVIALNCEVIRMILQTRPPPRKTPTSVLPQQLGTALRISITPESWLAPIKPRLNEIKPADYEPANSAAALAVGNAQNFYVQAYNVIDVC